MTEILTRGGIYLAKLDPTKGSEIGKIRPVLILNAQALLDICPSTIFICPLSSQSHPLFSGLHIYLAARDKMSSDSYALVEHCRSITTSRLIYPRLAQATSQEINEILHRLKRMIDA